MIVRILTNNADPGEMSPYVAFHPGDSLQEMSVSVCSNERVSRLTCSCQGQICRLLLGQI